MNFFAENIYTVILIPFWFMLIILFGKLFAVIKSKKIVNSLVIVSSLYCLIFSIGAFIKTALTKGYIYEAVVPFIRVSNFNFNVGVYFDGVSAWMLLLAAVISFLVQVYSFYYMNNDKSYIRYFALMQFFNFSMFGLILSQNMFQMYIFWELVGVSSYLLIGFWYRDLEVSTAAKKAFIINRIGDFSMLSGIVLFSGIIYFALNNSISAALPFSEMNYLSAQIYGCTSDVMFFTVCILLLGGAVAKSAQFPLHSWLIDAMKGPTPVSALIHSATMVAAGVFLLIRLYPLFSLSHLVLNIISIIGIITAVMCSIAALTQTDIKKILAYSTNAQLGLMFLAVGCCSTTIALFHLTSHAFAKAMLFLASGAVIYAFGHKQDIRFAGGLRKKMPVCAGVFLIGIFSLSGLLFSGFSSKEMIISSLVGNHHYIYSVLFSIISFLTVFYLFRLYFYLFEGNEVLGFEYSPISKTLITVPIIFSLFVIFLWCILPKSGNILFIFINYLVAVAAAFLAYIFYLKRDRIKKIPVFYNLSYSAIYTEDLVHFVIKSYDNVCKFSALIQKYFLDGVVYIVSLFTRLTALVFSKMQSGNVQTYLAYSIFVVMMSFGGVLLLYSLIIYFSEVQ